MSKINIENVEYETDDFSDELNSEVQMLQYTDRRILEIQRELAARQTPRNAYSIRIRKLLKGDHDHQSAEEQQSQIKYFIKNFGTNATCTAVFLQ